MSRKSLVSSLAIVILLLLITTSFATYKAYNYRNLYLYHPQTKVERHDSVVTKYAGFDPNRSAAYDCVPQKISPTGVGMVCYSPDKTITVNCTAVAGSIVEYFC